QFIGWKRTVGGIGVAWDKIQNDRILPEYDMLNLTWVLSDCREAEDAGSIIEWKEWGVDVVLGPACSEILTFVAAIVSGIVAKSLNFPIVVWAPAFSSELLNTSDYPTLMSPTYSSMKYV
ncbi:hypothetical protein Angca_000228, partial [Angiostrongylus cantonensis]